MKFLCKSCLFSFWTCFIKFLTYCLGEIHLFSDSAGCILIEMYDSFHLTSIKILSNYLNLHRQFTLKKISISRIQKKNFLWWSKHHKKSISFWLDRVWVFWKCLIHKLFVCDTHTRNLKTELTMSKFREKKIKKYIFEKS